MKTYIYPENLRATVRLWFWNVRDFIIICAGIIISVMLFAKLWTPVPMAMTACYAFLTLRADESAIIDYMTMVQRSKLLRSPSRSLPTHLLYYN